MSRLSPILRLATPIPNATAQQPSPEKEDLLFSTMNYNFCGHVPTSSSINKPLVQ
jgi:hypothetical protein